MAAPTIDVRSFVEDLDIPRRLHTLQPAADAPSAVVDDGSVVSFTAGVSPQHQADVTNSVLLAQLAANKRYDREQDTENWYKFYRNVLETVGWVVPSFSFAKFETANDVFYVDDVVVQLLAAIAAGDELAVVQKALAALKALDDKDDRIVLFERSSHTASNGSFQVSSVGEDGGQVVMKLSCFYFSTSDTVTRLLWFGFPSRNTRFYQSAQTMQLDEDVYSTVREAIVTKLGANAVKDVLGYDI